MIKLGLAELDGYFTVLHRAIAQAGEAMNAEARAELRRPRAGRAPPRAGIGR